MLFICLSIVTVTSTNQLVKVVKNSLKRSIINPFSRPYKHHYMSTFYQYCMNDIYYLLVLWNCQLIFGTWYILLQLNEKNILKKKKVLITILQILAITFICLYKRNSALNKGISRFYLSFLRINPQIKMITLLYLLRKKEPILIIVSCIS